MTRLLAIVLLIALGLPAWAAKRQLVPAIEIVGAAQAMLEAKASNDKVNAKFALVGHVNDVKLPVAREAVVSAGEMKTPWLRPRVGVPVRVSFADGKSTSVTVWFSVTAPAQGEVYEANYPRGTAVSNIKMKTGAVDLARMRGKPGVTGKATINTATVSADPTASSVTTDSTTVLRLRRAVTAGSAVQADDFEPMPAVQAQQSIRIDVGHGVVRLSTKGRALTDGAVGQLISVLPANATQPVRARVVSDQVVTIEN